MCDKCVVCKKDQPSEFPVTQHIKILMVDALPEKPPSDAKSDTPKLD